MTTWENAAADVGRTIRDMQIGGYPNPLDAVENFIDNTYGDPSVDPRATFFLIADEALSVFAVLTDTPRAVALDNVLTTIAEKQADYGPQNILWAGAQGILLRMHDKTARIRHLSTRTAASNEPLADSWLDLVGYSIVGIMLIDGTFEYPLQRDLPVPVEPSQALHHRYREMADIVVPDSTGTDNPFVQAEEDPDIKEAFRQFMAQATAPAEATRTGDDAFTIEGGGTIQVFPAPDGSHTHVTLTDGEGGVLDIMAAYGVVNVDTDGTVFNLSHSRMSVLLCMLLGAAEAGLNWRNTNVTAEVPRERD